MRGKNYINRLIDGDARAFDEIYYAYKDLFLALMQKMYGHKIEAATNLYHRALAALDNNVRTGRIKRDELPDEKVKAYIINTGKQLSWNDYRKKPSPLFFDTDYVMNYKDKQMDEPFDDEAGQKVAIVRQVVKEMKMPCSQLLILAIFEERSNKEIADIMQYANADSAKIQRHRCLSKLRGAALKRLKDSGYEI